MGLLDSGPLIEARLLELCPAAEGNVFSTADLKGVVEAKQVTPALHVVIHSYKPVEDTHGADNRWRETWLVIAVVKHVRQNAGAGAIRDAAPQILKEALAALDGWKCPGTVNLVRAVAPPDPLITAGFGYFPLAFSVQVVTDGAANLYD